MPNTHSDIKSTVQLRKVLAVDNDPIMLKFLTRILEKAGLKVVTAGDGVTAIDTLETYTPDLFLIDLIMPNIDGRALCRIIRSKKEFKTTPIVIISAIAAEESINTVKLGANICIAKVAFAEMEVIINKFLNAPQLLWDPTLGNRVLGVEDLSPRNITNELLTINRHFRIMLDSISNGIIEIDQNKRIIYANPSALRFFSMPAETLLGNYVSRIFQSDTDESFLSLINASASKGDPISRHIRMTARNRLLDVSVVPSNHDRNTQVIVMEDITLREKAQKDLLEANNKLEILSRIDGLTNVYNRRHFDEVLHHEWGRLKRENGELALLLCDVDYFKDFNDTYGHLEGDQCLKDIARTIDSTLQRPSDMTARYGGDEFVIILPNTKLEGAMHLAENVRDNVSRLQIRHEKSPVADHVTVTIGVSSGFPDDALPEDKFIWLADKGLYEAKMKGRNCYIGNVFSLDNTNG
jgi:diguanylate cyclase (GGDEF)-like protein/PAS domain S-box-containing protein